MKAELEPLSRPGRFGWSEVVVVVVLLLFVVVLLLLIVVRRPNRGRSRSSGRFPSSGSIVEVKAESRLEDEVESFDNVVFRRGPLGRDIDIVMLLDVDDYDNC
jgi:hypothetical protein